MRRTLNEFIASLPEVERVKIEARARELIAEEMSLQDLRKAIGKTQAAIARRLKVGQDAVSKLEGRSDMYISTLRSVLKAMGGELDLIARFPKSAPEFVSKNWGALHHVAKGIDGRHSWSPSDCLTGCIGQVSRAASPFAGSRCRSRVETRAGLAKQTQFPRRCALVINCRSRRAMPRMIHRAQTTAALTGGR